MLKYEGPQKHAFVLFITHLIVQVQLEKLKNSTYLTRLGMSYQTPD